MGLAVAGAGAIFGAELGFLVVAVGQLIGLIVNWNLCRHCCRNWFISRFKRRNRTRWLLSAMNSSLSWQSILLLRLSLLPTAAVSACCALSATSWRPYAMSSAVLVIRFGLMVNAGALGVSLIRSEGSIQGASLLAVTATATLIGIAFVNRTEPRRTHNKSESHTTSTKKRHQ